MTLNVCLSCCYHCMSHTSIRYSFTYELMFFFVCSSLCLQACSAGLFRLSESRSGGVRHLCQYNQPHVHQRFSPGSHPLPVSAHQRPVGMWVITHQYTKTRKQQRSMTIPVHFHAQSEPAYAGFSTYLWKICQNILVSYLLTRFKLTVFIHCDTEWNGLQSYNRAEQLVPFSWDLTYPQLCIFFYPWKLIINCLIFFPLISIRHKMQDHSWQFMFWRMDMPMCPQSPITSRLVNC